MSRELAHDILMINSEMRLTSWVVRQFFGVRLQWLTRLNSANHAPLVF